MKILLCLVKYDVLTCYIPMNNVFELSLNNLNRNFSFEYIISLNVERFKLINYTHNFYCVFLIF